MEKVFFSIALLASAEARLSGCYRGINIKLDFQMNTWNQHKHLWNKYRTQGALHTNDFELKS